LNRSRFADGFAIAFVTPSAFTAYEFGGTFVAMLCRKDGLTERQFPSPFIAAISPLVSPPPFRGSSSFALLRTIITAFSQTQKRRQAVNIPGVPQQSSKKDNADHGP